MYNLKQSNFMATARNVLRGRTAQNVETLFRLVPNSFPLLNYVPRSCAVNGMHAFSATCLWPQLFGARSRADTHPQYNAPTDNNDKISKLAHTKLRLPLFTCHRIHSVESSDKLSVFGCR